MKLIEIPGGKICITLPIETLELTNGEAVSGVRLIGRLLSYEEYLRVFSFSRNTSRAICEIEDDVFDLCVESVLGLETKISSSDIASAGIVSTISAGIISKTEDILSISGSEKRMENLIAGITEVEQLCVIVSRFMNIPYDQVFSLPVNEVYRKFAIVAKTFKREIALIFGDLGDAEPE